MHNTFVTQPDALGEGGDSSAIEPWVYFWTSDSYGGVDLRCCVSHAFASVHCCLVATCWERADLLALVGDVYY